MKTSLLVIFLFNISVGFAQLNEPMSFMGPCTISNQPAFVSLIVYRAQDSTNVRGSEILYHSQEHQSTCPYNFFFCFIKDSSVYISQTRTVIIDDTPDAYITADAIRIVNPTIFTCKPDQETLVLKKFDPTVDPPKHEEVIFYISDVPTEKPDKNIGEEPIADFAEVEPQFQGGEEAMKKFIAENLTYPSDGTHAVGTVYVQFVVRSDGSLTDITILKGVAKSLDQEAIRIISIMPKWIPGSQNGKVIAVRYQIPIRFSIQ